MLYEILFYFTAIVGLALFAFYYANKNKLDSGMKAVGPYMWLTAISCIYEVVFTRWLYVDATIWFRVYSLLEVLSILYYFKSVVTGHRSFFWIALMGYLAAFVYMLIYFREYDIQECDQVLAMITTLLVYACSILWFRQRFIAMDQESLLESGSFYFVSALLIYFSATIFLFLSAKLIYTTNRELLVQYWIFNIVMVILTRFVLIQAIWKGRKI